MLKMKADEPERYLGLESLLNKSFFDPLEAYPAGTLVSSTVTASDRKY